MKKLSLLLTLLCLTLSAWGKDNGQVKTQGNGQNKEVYQVSVPEFTSFFIVNAENVNFRKSPSTNSAKLMQWSSDMGSEETQMALFFSDDTSGKYRANSITGAFVTTAHPYQGQILPIVDESGDWYKVEYVTKKNIGEYTSKSAWIMKRFGETKVITAGDMKYPNESESQVFRRLNGKYKGTSFVTLITNEYNDWDNYFTFCMNIPIFISQKYLLMKGVYILGYINSSSNIHKLGRTALEDVFTGDSDEYFSTNFRSLDEVDLVTFLAGLSDEDFGKLIAEAMQAQGNLYVRTENGEMLYVPDENVSESGHPRTSVTVSF